MSLSKQQRKSSFVGQLPEHKISPAFKLGAIQYFQFDEDVFFLPYRRGLAAATTYKILQCGVNRDYLVWFKTEMQNCFKDPKLFDIGKMALMVNQLGERVDFIFDEDMIYELASIVYFDESENPYQYNTEYGRKKIKLWKESEKIEDFFLRQPIKRLIPFLKEQEENILNYLEVSRKIKEQHTQNLSSYKSSVH